LFDIETLLPKWFRSHLVFAGVLVAFCFLTGCGKVVSQSAYGADSNLATTIPGDVAIQQLNELRVIHNDGEQEKSRLNADKIGIDFRSSFLFWYLREPQFSHIEYRCVTLQVRTDNEHDGIINIWLFPKSTCSIGSSVFLSYVEFFDKDELRRAVEAFLSLGVELQQ